MTPADTPRERTIRLRSKYGDGLTAKTKVIRAGFAIHRTVMRSGGQDGWTVTHAESGVAMTHHASLVNARRLLAVLATRMPSIESAALFRLSGPWREWAPKVVRMRSGKFPTPPRTRPAFKAERAWDPDAPRAPQADGAGRA